MSKKITVILDDEDEALLLGLRRIFAGMKIDADEDEAPGTPATGETPTRTRRSRADAGAASSTTEPASDAGASDGRRRRRTSEPAEEVAAADPTPTGRRSRVTTAEAPAQPSSSAPANTSEPVRRRRTAPAVEGISDAEVAKAASQAAQKLTPALVMQIMKEDHGVTLANDIPQDQRQKFLDTLKAEMAD